MLWRWMPWKFLIGRAARAYDIIDPVQVLARLRRFSQPSEVQEPLELLRAGVIFQARGLINARVIQYNLDWVWPYWVERQFGPEDPSFVPRSFSFGHVNLTQRSWTAVGHPDLPIYVIVDPRGLVTPFYDGWSLDFWLVDEDGTFVLPSRQPQHHVHQHVRWNPQLTVQTRFESAEGELNTDVCIQLEERRPVLNIAVSGRSPKGGWLVVSLRPYNPEGISFVEDLVFDARQPAWRVNRKYSVVMDRPPDRMRISEFRHGDVFHRLFDRHANKADNVHCTFGLVTGAAAYKLDYRRSTTVNLKVPMARALRREYPQWEPSPNHHENGISGILCKAVLPDEQYQFLYENAVHTLLMLSAGDIYPGPYTYKRFWFRDGCLMLHALLCLGEIKRAHRHLQRFVRRQNLDGYFQSQEGEWDSNGQVLWIMGRYQQISAQPLPSAWTRAILRAAHWILAKRTPRTGGEPHAGLLPAGFSAEHLGPNDFYFWDDFWAIAGLKAAARMMASAVSPDLGTELAQAADRFEADVFACIDAIDPRRRQGGIPASPYRRMDAGAIGSMVADYPLQLTQPGDPRILATLEHLISNHFIRGGFFQDMIHSGINAYLTLDLAQTLLRAGDDRYRELIQAIADLASPTGNWPEAVHPFSGGGCMGDGQHGWAAAEWIMMIRNLFVREENGRLIVGSGLFPDWLKDGHEIAFGPTSTPYGSISVRLKCKTDDVQMRLTCDWNGHAPPVEVRVPGFKPQTRIDPSSTVHLIPS